MPKRKAAKPPRDETAALYVRLPVEEAEKLDRVAFERKIPKREMIRMLVSDHLEEIPGFPVPHPVTIPPPPAGAGRMVYVPYDPPDVLTAADAAKLLQTDESTVVDLAERGELPARKVGDEWRFLRRALLDWLGGS